MGKQPAQPTAPAFHPSDVYMGNDLVQSSYLDGDKIVTKSIPTAEEAANKARRTSSITELEQAMKDYLPQLNATTPEFQNSINDTANSMLTSAQENFKKQFDPTMRNLQEEAGKKFGGLNNSFYADESKKLADIGAQSQAQIARDIELKKSDLTQQELGNKQSYYDNLGKQVAYLNSGVNDFYDVNNQRYVQGTQASDMYNSWDMNKYNAQLDAYNQAQNRRSAMMSSLFGAIG